MFDVFIGNLKDNIQHEVFPYEPNSLERVYRLERKVERKNIATRRSMTHNNKVGSVSTPSLP